MDTIELTDEVRMGQRRKEGWVRKILLLLVSALAVAIQAAPAAAIQCVPYAREVSGINLKGDAWQWWNAAAGLYDRGRTPKEGAVMVFTRQGSMRHGHVSVITRVVSSRLALIDHANWAPARTAGRGEVTRAVPVLDVSPNNDWSQVRVWYHASKDFGNRAYRTDGFVYQPKREGTQRPAIHQAALHKAEEMFPSHKAQAKAELAKIESAKAEPVKSVGGKVEFAKIETAKPAEAAPVVAAALTPAAYSPVAIASGAHPSAAHPSAEGLIKVAKHVFRPRQPGAATLDTLLYN